jgi:hypothetical protein
LTEQFATEYTGRLFYFCLRKCGDVTQAQDLAQDISLNVLIALQKSTPENLSAYVWRIARNRYAKWVESKSRNDGFRQFRFAYEGISNSSPDHISISQDAILEKIAQGNITVGLAEEDVNFLLTNGYIRKQDQSYQLTFTVIKKAFLWDDEAEAQAINPAFMKDIAALKSQAIDIADTYYKLCAREIMNEVPSFLRENRWQIRSAIASSFYMARSAIVEESLRIGYLRYDPTADHRMLGALFIL